MKMTFRVGSRWYPNTMIHRCAFILLMLLTGLKRDHVHAQTPGFQQNGVQKCPGNTNISGYTNITSLTSDMESALQLIAAGGKPLDSYIFVLCPNTQFEIPADGFLPKLSGSIFICGNKGDVADKCVFNGSQNLIVLNNSTVPNYTLQEVSFLGVTFTGFSNAAFSGNAGSDTTVKIDQSRFEGFNSQYVISQNNGDGQQPFNVEIKDSSISGNAGVALSNNGGSLTVENLSVASSNLVSLISSGSSSSNSAATTIVTGAEVKDSSIPLVFASSTNSEMNLAGITVSNVNNVTDVFRYQGKGSKGKLDDVTVSGNKQVGQPWSVVGAYNNSDVTVNNFTFTDSTQVQNVFASRKGSTVRVSNANIRSVTGATSQDANGVVNGDGGKINVDGLVTSDVSNFTSMLFSSQGANLQIANSCVGSGSSQATAFVSSDSKISSNTNYVDPTFSSVKCPDGQNRLVQEDAGSTCFQSPGSPCASTCQPFFDSNVCTRSITTAPNTAASSDRPSHTPTFSLIVASEAPSAAPTRSIVPPTTSIVPSVATQGPSTNQTTLVPTAPSTLLTFSPSVVSNTPSVGTKPPSASVIPTSVSTTVPSPSVSTIVPRSSQPNVATTIPSGSPIQSIVPSSTTTSTPVISIVPSSLAAPSQSPTTSAPTTATGSPTVSFSPSTSTQSPTIVLSPTIITINPTSLPIMAPQYSSIFPTATAYPTMISSQTSGPVVSLSPESITASPLLVPTTTQVPRTVPTPSPAFVPSPVTTPSLPTTPTNKPTCSCGKGGKGKRHKMRRKKKIIIRTKSKKNSKKGGKDKSKKISSKYYYTKWDYRMEGSKKKGKSGKDKGLRKKVIILKKRGVPRPDKNHQNELDEPENDIEGPQSLFSNGNNYSDTDPNNNNGFLSSVESMTDNDEEDEECICQPPSTDKGGKRKRRWVVKKIIRHHHRRKHKRKRRKKESNKVITNDDRDPDKIFERMKENAMERNRIESANRPHSTGF